MKLKDIAHARSGDKGEDANIGVIAYDETGYQMLVDKLTEEKVKSYFAPLGLENVRRFLLPNLQAVNFVLEGIFPGGASMQLQIDGQGKALGQAILEMKL